MGLSDWDQRQLDIKSGEEQDRFMNRRNLIAGVGASAVATPAKAEDAEAVRFRDALERIALLDEADGHELADKQAFQAVGIACAALGNKHPSVILVEREARLKAR